MKISYETLNLLATSGDKEAKATSFSCQEYPFEEIRAYVEKSGYVTYAVWHYASRRNSMALRLHYGI